MGASAHLTIVATHAFSHCAHFPKSLMPGFQESSAAQFAESGHPILVPSRFSIKKQTTGPTCLGLELWRLEVRNALASAVLTSETWHTTSSGEEVSAKVHRHSISAHSRQLSATAGGLEHETNPQQRPRPRGSPSLPATPSSSEPLSSE